MGGGRGPNCPREEEIIGFFRVVFIEEGRTSSVRGPDVPINGNEGLVTECWSETQKDAVRFAVNRWNEIITSIPGDDQDRLITLYLYVGRVEAEGGFITLGSAIPSENEFDDETYDNEYYNAYVDSGEIFINSVTDAETVLGYESWKDTLVHEMGHVFGIGTYWFTVDQERALLKPPDAGSQQAQTGNLAKLFAFAYAPNGNPVYMFNNFFGFPPYEGNNELLSGYEDWLDDGTNPLLYTFYTGREAREVFNYFDSEGNSYEKDGIDTGYKNTQWVTTSYFPGFPIEDGRIFEMNGSETGGFAIDAHILEGRDAGGDPYNSGSISTMVVPAVALYVGGPMGGGGIFVGLIPADQFLGEYLYNFSSTPVQLSEIDGYYYYQDATPLSVPSFNSEIMTALNEDVDKKPLSAITVGMMADLGYGVDWSKCDPYELNA